MDWFIDWLSGRFPLSTPVEVNGGRIIWVNKHGAKEYAVERRLQLVGSDDARIQVRTAGDYLEFSGNPTKWFQGHNLWGPNSVRFTSYFFAFAICAELGIEPSPQDWYRWFCGDVQLSRVDCTRMLRPLDTTPGWVPKWLSIAASVAHGGHQRITNRGAYEGNTLYVGQHSRRISMKIYDKAAELKRHPPMWPVGVSVEEGDAHAAALAAYAADTLRVEVTIRGMELKERGLDRAAAWSRATGGELLDERISKLTALEGLEMTEDEVSDLPRRLKAPYRMWLAGDDLRELYSRRQFYRYRAALLPYGVDIAHVRPRVVVTERAHALGRPLKDFITGPGLDPPDDDLMAAAWSQLGAAMGD